LKDRMADDKGKTGIRSRTTMKIEAILIITELL